MVSMERKPYKGYGEGMERAGNFPPVTSVPRQQGRRYRTCLTGISGKNRGLRGLVADSCGKAAPSCISDGHAFVRLPRLEGGRYIMLRQGRLK